MTNLWLGAEYNQNYGDTECTHSIMRQYLKTGIVKNNPDFFEKLKAQVSCFGNPNDFHYDDLSQVKASGKHTEKNQFELNVRKSVDHHKGLFRENNPNIVLIGGTDAFKAWCQIILPYLKFDNLVVIKIRNPSPQAHWGEHCKWVKKYRKYKADLSGYKEGLNLLHLKCSNIESDFELIELPERRFINKK